MIREVELFSPDDVMHFDRGIIDAVALPMGDVYGGEVFQDYLSYYAGYGKTFKPKRIFEIGIRFGYTAISMMMGAHNNPGSPKPVFIGIDDESYHYGSCAKANSNFKQLVPWADAQAVRWNAFHGMPEGIGTFDLIHIDGHHARNAIFNDLGYCLPMLNAGGIIVLDDAKPANDDGSPAEVYDAILDFMRPYYTNSEVNFEVQLVPNLRYHYLIKKID